MGQGSGVVVDTKGYILTNYHVVDGVESVDVRLSDGRHATASVIGADRHDRSRRAENRSAESDRRRVGR